VGPNVTPNYGNPPRECQAKQSIDAMGPKESDIRLARRAATKERASPLFSPRGETKQAGGPPLSGAHGSAVTHRSEVAHACRRSACSAESCGPLPKPRLRGTGVSTFRGRPGRVATTIAHGFSRGEWSRQSRALERAVQSRGQRQLSSYSISCFCQFNLRASSTMAVDLSSKTRHESAGQRGCAAWLYRPFQGLSQWDL
jgi:hypothetical protein